MKKGLFIAAALLCMGTSLSAQYKYEFTVVKENPATPVKNQASTGTCWCFSTNSFIESELIRMGKGEYDLSEMFIVRNNYITRMKDNYLRRGRGNVSQGSLAHMYIKEMTKNGLMTEEAYDGINYDSPTHNHGDLQQWVQSVSKTAVEMKKPIPQEILDGVMDAYLGKVPATFTHNGKEYTAQSFYKSLGINPNDYVELTSFTHHPFYQLIPVEVPDNWDHAMMYNLPLDEFMAVIDNAINTGYTVVWDGDVSEPGYAFPHNVAVLCNENIKKEKEIKERPVELAVDQDIRQNWYETFVTTDDHLEHITGIAKDQEGVKYYKTKNSWGTARNGSGYHYMSENFIKAKTISILVHKNSIPKATRAKLGIK